MDMIRKKDIQRYTIFWVIYWLGLMSFLSLVLKPMGVNAHETPYALASYFFISGCIGLKLFFPIKSLGYIKNTKTQLVLIFLSSLIFIFVGYIAKDFFILKDETRESLLRIGLVFPLFETSITIAKIADIFFQQSLILSLVLYLKEKSNSKRVTVGLFSGIFLIIHLPLFYLFGWIALYFIVPSIFAGAIFSTLILRSSIGLLYSFLLHQFFYIALGIGIRLI